MKHGEYRIERELGHGGFGVTYSAVQVGLNRRVAIKEFFMSEYCNRDAETSHVTVPSEGSRELVARFRNKFIKEAQNIASLKHPHIISIHDVFEDNGTAYYVMEYLDHGSLADLVKRQGSLPEADALRYTRQIADALRYIHARKMSHLDVKPGNILIDEEDHAVLIDFGLSKRYDDEGNQTSTTPVGISHGYAPLEQYKKGGVGTFSPSTDIYSLGATLYKLITGATPPDANDILIDGLPAHPDVMSLPVYEAIEQAMQPNKNHRPQSIGAFLTRLDAPATPAPETAKVEDVPTEVITEEPASVDNDNTAYPLRFEEESPMERDSADITVPSPHTKSSFSPKKLLWPLLACLVAVGIFFGVRTCNDYRAEAARLAEIEQHRLDSIAQVEEDVEKAKQAQLEQQRKDSLSLVPSGESNGYGYVDLGLSVKWATCNVGASAPYEAGDRYAWGETSTKKEYTEKNSATYGKSMKGIAGSSSHDAAYAQWKGDWHIPTKEHCQELIDKCTWTWTTLQGVNGYRVTGPSGKSIFLPIVKGYGDYWSSTPNEEDPSYSYHLYFDGSEHSLYPKGRRLAGLSIRPVAGELAKAKEEQSRPTKSIDNSSKQDSKKKTSSSSKSEQKENANKSKPAQESKTDKSSITSTTQGKSTTTNTAVPTSRTGTINGHEYVDLGLSVLWATCNVDATSPSEYGGHYAWAETSTKSSYTKENHRFYDSSKDEIMGIQWIVGSKYDVAHVKWGSRWRMPTRVELAELFDERKCKREWMTYNGKEGFLITGPNGNSIFLPAASHGASSSKEGFYRSGEDLHTFQFGKDECEDVRYVESTGCSIRPVYSSYAGHESVDLGLSVRWATCNVGAYSPSHKGYRFEWGDTEVETLKTKVTYGKNIGSELSGNASYDAARVHWGGAWRLPTESEQRELVDKCTWTWTKLNGVSGYRVTGPNGNSIFLPYCGVIDTYYWSGSTDDNSIYSGYSITFDENEIYITFLNRDAGGRIRPVTD